MKRTITINLGGYAFIIDEDAYDKLKNYLGKIDAELKYAADKKEIVEDIEIRIAEILKENSKINKEVIDVADIEEIIKTIGNPSDFKQEAEGYHDEGHKSANFRRIYRDPDNRVLGGVCGGLGAYFNVDPLLLRILFLVFAIVAGSGIIVYIVLWIVIPEAKTVAQKLEMRGEPVNISTIGEKIKEEFNNVKRKMNL